MEQVKKVLVLYVGGTIGMQRNNKGVLSPVPNALLNKIKQHPELHDVIWAQEYYTKQLKENQLILPQTYGPQKIIYEIIEYTELLDSSNMTCKDWIRLANDIKDHYNNYDGFVILHGTDTLGYTSSALSFMLENLQKPVIVTGSQISIYEGRSDAKDNFLSSVLIAGSFRIPEVCVFFANKLYRGNRTAKISTNDFNAFDSPNYHSLIDVGIGYRILSFVNDGQRYSSAPISQEVGTVATLDSFLRLPIEGVVIQSFGTGNIPSERKDLIEVLRNAINRETLIVNVTQCPRGNVCGSYETGKVLDEIGIVSGEDMTVEAALTKLAYVLGLPGLTFSQKTQLMYTDLRGEMDPKI